MMLTDATEEGLAEMARVQLHAVLENFDGLVIAVLRQRLLDGRVNGHTYWQDDCGCVLGTLAFFDGADDSADEAMAYCPATVYALENWAAPIELGDVPDHTQHEDSGRFRAAVLVSWIDEFEWERVGA